MDDRNTGDRGRLQDDPDFGGSSAGAQDGGMVDAGAADDETDYTDDLTGRKGGMVGLRDDEDYDNGEFRIPDEREDGEGFGSLGDFDTVGTDHGMPGTWAGGESTTNSSGL